MVHGDQKVFDWPLYDGGALIGPQRYFREESDMPVAIQAWVLQPGQCEGGHTHPEESPLEEIHLVISGEAEVTVAGETRTLHAGDAMLAKVGVDHDIRNSGTEPLRLIMIWGKPEITDWSSYRMGKAASAARAEDAPNVWWLCQDPGTLLASIPGSSSCAAFA